MKRFALSLLLWSLIGVAHATSGLTIVNKTSIPRFSFYNGQPATVTGVLSRGSFGALSAKEAGIFYATFLGQESGFVNQYSLSLNSALLETNALGTTISKQVAPGIISFTFSDDKGGVFSNGQTQNSVLGFAIIDGQTNRFGKFDYILGFNDSFGKDADYDDFVVGVRFVAAPIPEPETYAMMFAGLGLIGFAARRRKN
jgi:PEP-CTERM motif